eukprot:jgi/Tetstr1/455576/TSEL_004065.t1
MTKLQALATHNRRSQAAATETGAHRPAASCSGVSYAGRACTQAPGSPVHMAGPSRQDEGGVRAASKPPGDDQNEQPAEESAGSRSGGAAHVAGVQRESGASQPARYSMSRQPPSGARHPARWQPPSGDDAAAQRAAEAQQAHPNGRRRSGQIAEMIQRFRTAPPAPREQRCVGTVAGAGSAQGPLAEAAGREGSQPPERAFWWNAEHRGAQTCGGLAAPAWAAGEARQPHHAAPAGEGSLQRWAGYSAAKPTAEAPPQEDEELAEIDRRAAKLIDLAKKRLLPDAEQGMSSAATFDICEATTEVTAEEDPLSSSLIIEGAMEPLRYDALQVAEVGDDILEAWRRRRASSGGTAAGDAKHRSSSPPSAFPLEAYPDLAEIGYRRPAAPWQQRGDSSASRGHWWHQVTPALPHHPASAASDGTPSWKEPSGLPADLDIPRRDADDEDGHKPAAKMHDGAVKREESLISLPQLQRSSSPPGSPVPAASDMSDPASDSVLLELSVSTSASEWRALLHQGPSGGAPSDEAPSDEAEVVGVPEEPSRDTKDSDVVRNTSDVQPDETLSEKNTARMSDDQTPHLLGSRQSGRHPGSSTVDSLRASRAGSSVRDSGVYSAVGSSYDSAFAPELQGLLGGALGTFFTTPAASGAANPSRSSVVIVELRSSDEDSLQVSDIQLRVSDDESRAQSDDTAVEPSAEVEKGADNGELAQHDVLAPGRNGAEGACDGLGHEHDSGETRNAATSAVPAELAHSDDGEHVSSEASSTRSEPSVDRNGADVGVDDSTAFARAHKANLDELPTSSDDSPVDAPQPRDVDGIPSSSKPEFHGNCHVDGAPSQVADGETAPSESTGNDHIEPSAHHGGSEVDVDSATGISLARGEIVDGHETGDKLDADTPNLVSGGGDVLSEPEVGVDEGEAREQAQCSGAETSVATNDFPIGVQRQAEDEDSGSWASDALELRVDLGGGAALAQPQSAVAAIRMGVGDLTGRAARRDADGEGDPAISSRQQQRQPTSSAVVDVPFDLDISRESDSAGSASGESEAMTMSSTVAPQPMEHGNTVAPASGLQPEMVLEHDQDRERLAFAHPFPVTLSLRPACGCKTSPASCSSGPDAPELGQRHKLLHPDLQQLLAADAAQRDHEDDQMVAVLRAQVDRCCAELRKLGCHV